MKIFLESIDKGVWDAVVNGPFKPIKIVDRETFPKEFSQWTPDENKRAYYDVRAKNIISYALILDEFYRVSVCESAKEIWDVLEVTHEGTDEVKRARKNTLIQEYEMFRMKTGESICDVQKRFTHIVNHLLALGKIFDKKELNIKILKSLNRTWQPKVTAISESKDLTSMNIATLFGKLREHELELGRLKAEVDGEKRHTIALKSAVKSAVKQKKADFADDSNDGNSGSEALSLMVKKFSKFLKYKNKTNNSYAGNKRQSRSGTQTCYECGKTGYIKADCPVLKMKQKLDEKNEAEKHLKKKKAYIAWEENDSSTSSESDDSTEEENNLCLMAKAETSIKAESSKNSVSSFTSEHEENDYYELLDAFNELHKEATKLQKSNSKRKGEITWLEGRIKQLEEENENLTTCLEK
ncbi:uncharacterized protein LOC114163549 [Vigna unguiculata]|uniref:uncharacterized protein LOC114163549 n=1 Tax=Vigna unguiculata TaxID=3917 RepID=UPI001016424F|nr:uncharacterized protein LOC114163549 [Vigna unguiculata]